MNHKQLGWSLFCVFILFVLMGLAFKTIVWMLVSFFGILGVAALLFGIKWVYDKLGRRKMNEIVIKHELPVVLMLEEA